MYLFPFEKIKQGSKVVIYGAGNVGLDWVLQINKTGYCEISCVLDKNFKKKEGFPVDVFPPEKIRSVTDYTVVMIATINDAWINEARETLIELGVPATKILIEKIIFYHTTKTGNYYLPTNAPQDIVINTMVRDEIFDAPIYHTAKKYIKPDTIVLDVGSNFGQMAVMMSKHIGTAGRVYAFEANAFVFEFLKKNIEANNAPITPVFGAVHNKCDEVLFFSEVNFKEFGAYGSYGIDYATNKGTPVKSLTIDSIKFDMPVSFMKVDVQGGDLLVLQGAVETIKKYQMPIVFEFEHYFQETYKLCFQDYVDFVQSIDYYFAYVPQPDDFLILPNSWRNTSV